MDSQSRQPKPTTANQTKITLDITIHHHVFLTPFSIDWIHSVNALEANDQSWISFHIWVDSYGTRHNTSVNHTKYGLNMDLKCRPVYLISVNKRYINNVLYDRNVNFFASNVVMSSKPWHYLSWNMFCALPWYRKYSFIMLIYFQLNTPRSKFLIPFLLFIEAVIYFARKTLSTNDPALK